MAEKKKKKRRAYLESFQKDENGKYVYKGDAYIYKGTDKKSSSPAQENDLRRELIRLGFMGVILLISLVAEGCMTAPGMDNCFYVLLPYVAGLMAGVSVCWALYRLTAGGNPLKSYIYDASVKALPVRTVMVIVCAALGIAGEIIFIFRQGIGGKLLGCLSFFALNALIIFISVMLRRRVLCMKWEK